MRTSPKPAGRAGKDGSLSSSLDREPARRRLFLLLVAQVALVGAVIGTERTVLPLLAEAEFGLASTTAVLSFILAFGLAKAPANFVAGRLADRYGRKRVLVAGWVVALPAPLLVALAPSWSWVIAANLLLGIQQGLCWSTSIFMKIDLVTTRRGGFVIGINELAGYGATAIAAYATGVLAVGSGLRLAPFLLGELFVVIGLVLAITQIVEVDASAAPNESDAPVVRRGSLGALAQAGFVIKLADVAVWGMLPLYFRHKGVGLGLVSLLAAAYPAAWGALQPFTGRWSDRIGRRPLIVTGMTVQAAALVALAGGDRFAEWLPALVALGAGTAFAYPVLLAAAGEVAPQPRRASAIGHYRLWRDLGFVGGALIVGLLTDTLGVPAALSVLGTVSLASGAVVRLKLLPGPAVRDERRV